MFDRGILLEPIYNGQKALCAIRMVIYDVEVEPEQRCILDIIELDRAPLMTLARKFTRHFNHQTHDMADQIFWYNNIDFGRATSIEIRIWKILQTFPEVSYGGH